MLRDGFSGLKGSKLALATQEEDPGDGSGNSDTVQRQAERANGRWGIVRG